MDLWTLAAQRKQENARKNAEWREDPTNHVRMGLDYGQHERSIIICGDKSCGKTTIINRFLERNENPKSTIALEYAYGRRTRGTIKDLVHIWEVGGGTSLTNLLEIPLRTSKIETTSMIIVLDMANIEGIWNTFHELTKSAKKVINEISEELKIKSPDTYECFLQRNKKFKDHKDSNLLNPFPIPLVIVGSKYDEFRNCEPEVRKSAYKYLRYMAHRNGASLQMFSTKMENTALKMRAQIGHLAFDGHAGKTLVLDPNKPIYMVAGKDSFNVSVLQVYSSMVAITQPMRKKIKGDIGPPPNVEILLSQISARNAFELWSDAFDHQFPQKFQRNAEKEQKEDMIGQLQFHDADIDSLFEQKTKDLEAFIKRKNERQRIEAKQLQ